jgi:two-component system, NtrC family, nitrogen regulation sensor histidine kinase NtrY
MAVGKVAPPVSISVLIALGAILLSLHLMSSATQNPSVLGDMYAWLLLINVLGSVLLFGLVVANVHSLVRQLKKREAGSHLTARMVFLFVLLSLAPASIVFYYSMQFLHQSIDSWFDVEIDHAMDDALELSRAAFDQRMRSLLKETEAMVERLEHLPDSVAAIELDALRTDLAASEVTLISEQERIIASSSINPRSIIPSLPDDSILLRLRQGKSYVGLDPIRNQGMQIRVVVTIDSEFPRYLQALYPVPVRLDHLVQSVEAAYAHYKELSYLRSALKMSFSLTLSLVLLLSLLGAVWVAFVSIRRLVAPIRDLVQGTRAVAAGNYEQRIPVTSRDELGFLVESFNAMTQRLAQARDEAYRSQLEVENQRAYLETLLGNLTSGVLSFDAEYRLRTANQAANKILNIELAAYKGAPLSALSAEHHLSSFVEMLQEKLEQAQTMWQEAITLLGPNGRQELLCRGTPLLTVVGERSGTVMVFDDMTDLIRAQRNAAWGQVAQRLAHEIKNPLTPIQLSAERLKHKLSKNLGPVDAEMLERATQTIVHQVEAMKTMVNAFSDYARPPKMQLEEVDINRLIEEVLTLYSTQGTVRFHVSLDSAVPGIEADPVRMRQVLHNLIKNAQEAVEARSPGEIFISTRCILENRSYYVEIRIQDNGPGIVPEQVDRVFEPYVTDKAKGTGLGLAIVKKIIEEHGGMIWVDPDYREGAGLVIRLPERAGHRESDDASIQSKDRRQTA